MIEGQPQRVPERITDDNGDELEHGADTDAELALRDPGTLLRLNDLVWVDPAYVVCCYGSTDGVRLLLATGEGVTIDPSNTDVAVYAESIINAQKEIRHG